MKEQTLTTTIGRDSTKSSADLVIVYRQRKLRIIINSLAVFFVAMLPFAFEKIALDTRPDPWPDFWFTNYYRKPEGSIVCDGKVSDIGFTDLKSIWPQAQEEA